MNTHCTAIAFFTLSFLGFAVGAQEKVAPGKIVKLEVSPDKILLQTPFAYRQLLVTGVTADGKRVDLTRHAKYTTPAFAKVSTEGQVRPSADGQGAIQLDVMGYKASIPIVVESFKKEYKVSFVRDVMPVLAKLGCNAGTCHGGAQGRNGFQLSLRGYDPAFDHLALTDDIAGRRFNRAAPDKSLMLLKPAGGVPHVGGVLTQPGDPYYETILAWIKQGVQFDKDSPRVVSMQVMPASPTIGLPGMLQQMTVEARYSDGSVRDVTAEAFLNSSNTEVATVDKAGLVKAIRRGEAAILARYEGNYAVAPLIVMGDRAEFAWKETPEFNFIDALVYEKLKQVKVQPSELCSDVDFLRRLYLDLTGLPPEADTVRAFLADTRPTKVKREELIDKLVGSPDFVEHWTNKWADLLQVNRKFLGDQGAAAFRKWIYDSVKSNKPYDKFALELLTADGSNIENPAASYFKILRDPEAAMENTTHLFLAVRFNCNKCHDHPFERWTQGQYYELSSFFAQISRKEDPRFKGQKTAGTAVQGPLPLVEIIGDAKKGEVTHLRTGQAAKPIFPFTHADMPEVKGPRRDQLAQWIVSKDNPYFAKSYVNRIWSYLLGVGIIEPVDDIRAGNPPTNPKLLERLTQEFVASGFNVQQLFKTICKSRTYQHALATNRWNEDDEINYSHALPRRLPAEVLYDAIHRATGSLSRLPGLPPGSRAAQLVDSNVPVPGDFLELFGRPARESACECERSNAMLLGPVLNLVNGPVLSSALRDPANRIAKIVAQHKDDNKVIEELYLSILCRPPSSEELAQALKAFQGNDAEYARILAEKKNRDKTLADYEATLPAQQAAWEKSVQRTPSWTVLDIESAKSAGGATLTVQKDKSILASGKNPSPETYTIVARTKVKDITGIRLEVLADPSLPGKGPGRAPNGNFVLSEFKAEFEKAVGKDKATPLSLVNPQATFSQANFPIAAAIDNNPSTGWAIANEFGKNNFAVLQAQTRFGFDEGTKLTFTMAFNFAGNDHNLGKFRLSVTTVNPPILLKGSTPENITQILEIDPAKRSEKDRAALTAYFRSLDQELARLQRLAQEIVLPPNPRALGAQDLAWALINSPAFLFNH